MDIVNQNQRYLDEERKEKDLIQKYAVDDEVKECEDEEGSSEEERATPKKRFTFDEISSESEHDDKGDDTTTQAESSQKADMSVATNQEPSVIISQNEAHGWALTQLLTVEEGASPLRDYDTHNERLFMLFENLRLVIADTTTGQVVQRHDLAEVLRAEMQEGEEPKARAFAVFSDVNLLAFSTQQAVYLVDYEQELKFSQRIQTAFVDFISLVDSIYLVTLSCNDDDDLEATLQCNIMFGEPEGKLTIKRFMGQKLMVKCGQNCVIFTCGSQIGRVTVPDMQLQWQEDTKHEGGILDFALSDTCIFTT